MAGLAGELPSTIAQRLDDSITPEQRGWLNEPRPLILEASRRARERIAAGPVSEVAMDARGTIVHLKDYGMIKLFKIVAQDGDIEYWATNDLTMDELTRLKYAEQVWMIEDYHRGIKQFCGIDRAQARSACAQRNHFQLALRAFLRLEHHRMLTGISWFEAKTDIIRYAVRAYLAHPLYTLGATA